MSDAPQHETVLDIGAESLGQVYARALLGATDDAGVSDEVLAQLGQIVDDYLGGSPQLAACFASPRVDEEEKSRIIDRLFGDSVHPLLIRFMKIMARRGRLGYLRAVRNAAVEQHDAKHGRLVAEVRTAVPLDDALRGEVTERLSASMGKQVRLRETVDETIVGGMVIRIGDTVYDSSVAGRLDKIGRAASRGFARQLLEQSDRFASEA